MHKADAHGNPLYKQRAESALRRGQIMGLVQTAVYPPGEDVYCHADRRSRDGQPLGLCGGYLFTRGPIGEAHVRVYEERRFHERRTVPRDNFRCPRCNGRLEIEHHPSRSAAA